MSDDGTSVLVIGGTLFMGYSLTWRLLFTGHRVTLLNRGTHPDPFGDRVERIRVDRTTSAFVDALRGRRFDAVVDFAAFTGEDARGAVDALGDRAGHYIVISTGQVYLVREGVPIPSRESDYDGPVMPEPPTPGERDRANWEYGTGKRAIEDVLSEAWDTDGFPSTRLRIPVVNGERDQSRRLESYLWRLVDGGPIVLPRGEARHVRQAYSGAVARSIVEDVLGNESAFGKAYNLCQDEIPSLADLVALLGHLMGVPTDIISVPDEMITDAGLDLVELFPFTSHWNSLLDPSRAKLELGFWHEPLPSYLDRIVASFLNNLPDEPPPSYAHRAEEIALAEKL